VRRPLPTTGMPGPRMAFPCLMNGVIQPDLRTADTPASSPPLGVVADSSNAPRQTTPSLRNNFEHSYAIFVSLDALGSVQSVDLESAS